MKKKKKKENNLENWTIFRVQSTPHRLIFTPPWRKRAVAVERHGTKERMNQDGRELWSGTGAARLRVPHRYGWLCKQDGRKVDRIARSRVTIIYLPAGPGGRVYPEPNTYPPAQQRPPRRNLHGHHDADVLRAYLHPWWERGPLGWWRSDPSRVTHERHRVGKHENRGDPSRRRCSLVT